MQKEKTFQLTKTEGWVNKKIKTNPEINIALEKWFKKYNIGHTEIPDNKPYLFFSFYEPNKLLIQESVFPSIFNSSVQYTELNLNFLNKKIWI